MPFALATDPLPIVRRDTLYGVTTDEFDVPYVVVAGGGEGAVAGRRHRDRACHSRCRSPFLHKEGGSSARSRGLIH